MAHYRKLVRDKIPAILDAKGVPYERTEARADEFKTELIRKLLEEAQEFAETPSLEELADVAEVFETLRTLPEYAEVEAERLRKREERGGFNGRIILEGEK